MLSQKIININCSYINKYSELIENTISVRKNSIVKKGQENIMACSKLSEEIAAVKAPWPLIMLVLNVVLPGIGTIFNSFMGERFNVTTFIVGIL